MMKSLKSANYTQYLEGFSKADYSCHVISPGVIAAILTVNVTVSCSCEVIICNFEGFQGKVIPVMQRPVWCVRFVEAWKT
jgi:hypothetical protein